MLSVSKKFYIPNANLLEDDVMGVEGYLTSTEKGFIQDVEIENKVYESKVKSCINPQKFSHRGRIELYIPKLKKHLYISIGMTGGTWSWLK